MTSTRSADYTKPLLIGIVGTGFNAQFHIKSLVQVRNCVVTGVVGRPFTDEPSKSAKETAELARSLKVGNPVIFKDAESMAMSDKVEAIWICSPNYTRVEVMQAIVRGNAKRAQPLLGIACEKPLASNLRDASTMLQLVQEAKLPTGYLENQVFCPIVEKGKDIIWRRAAPASGRPFLVRAAEEHSGPHAPWFWKGTAQGGGVLNDMMCHSVLAAKYLLSSPQDIHNLEVVKVHATIASLKWSQPQYSAQLQHTYPEGNLDYTKQPSEDYAHATIHFKDKQTQQVCIGELTTSWSFVGAGLRLSFEMLGPEYSLKANSLTSPLDVFLSRKIKSQAGGEDLLEKQNAEQGLMPVVVDEEAAYGYANENRHMVNCFLDGKQPLLTFADGVEVVKLLMACYYSAEREETVNPDAIDLLNFVPAVAKGTWKQ